jgi:VCBS repeat-containing protein
MATLTRVNGAAAPMEQVGRDLFVKNFAKENMTQAQLESLVTAVQQTSTITVIGAFTAGTSDSVNMIIEGADITANIAGCVTTTVAF